MDMTLLVNIESLHPGRGALHQMFGRGFQHAMKKWIQWDLRFSKMKGQKDLRTVKKKRGQ